MNKIKELIKREILEKLIGNTLPYRGQQKELVKFKGWWDPGFEFLNVFELSDIPVSGPVDTNVRFNFWGLIDIDGNSKKQVNIDGHFGPITISFEDSNYQVDCSKATISRLTIE